MMVRGPHSDELQSSGASSFSPTRSRRSQFSKDSSDPPDALLPPFRDTELAPNAASSSSVPLFAPSDPSAPSRCLSYPTSVSLQSPKCLPSSVHTLSISFCGEDFTYDLDTLENDPTPIIELLKATDSERGTWMMVAAHYRRSGNANAAIPVVKSLIALLTAQGLPESDLKPAYLLLSGCEIDLAKRVKAAKPDDAEEHYKRSQNLLQKVYGSQEAHTSQLSPTSTILQTLPRSIVYNAADDDIMPRQESQWKLRLEREIQSLLKEKDEEGALLTDIRAAKRKLEDDLAYECNGRRRLLRDYDDLQKELATARKMENYALSQVKREVDARRKAEEMARTEKGLRMELQSLFEQCPTPLGEIAANTMK
ncbi:hypothetical protein C0991_001653 [Blastosporella zonata]|nr:hypothetical protein C0991_001653 [Blastosporella zonata]